MTYQVLHFCKKIMTYLYKGCFITAKLIITQSNNTTPIVLLPGKTMHIKAIADAQY